MDGSYRNTGMPRTPRLPLIVFLALATSVSAGAIDYITPSAAPSRDDAAAGLVVRDGAVSGAGERRGGQPQARVRVAIPSAAIPGARRGPETVDASPPPAEPSPVVVAGTDESRSSSGESTSETTAREPDLRVLAVLDGREITDRDVLRELWERRGRETLDWMIGRAILERELSRLGLDVLDREIEERLQQHLDGLRLTFPNLRAADDLTRAAAGMKLDEYRERSVWAELALRKIMHVALKPTDDQLRGYYAERQAEFIQPERVRLSQVFIAPQATDDAEGPTQTDWGIAEKQILEAHTRLRMHEDFATVARAYGSGGQMSRWVGRGELLRELEERAFSQQPGAFSAPLKSSMGYHILRVEEKRERNQPKFEEVRGEVQAQYEEKLFVLMAGEFMTRLRERAVRGGELVLPETPELFADGE